MIRLTATEENEQRALIQWADTMTWKYPDLRLLFHIPNGGKRHIVTARKLRACGVKAGVPDLFLPAPRGPYHGMFLELKAAKGTVSTLQSFWLSDLTKRGYYAVVCYGWDAARRVIEDYLRLREVTT